MSRKKTLCSVTAAVVLSSVTAVVSVTSPVSAGGKVCFYVYGKAHLLADVSGYFPGQS